MRLFQGCLFIIRMSLDGNVDDLLDDVTGLFGFCLVTESYESSKNVLRTRKTRNQTKYR